MATKVAHHLRDKKIPVFFAPLRGMASKEELVSKLLSIFADTKHISDAKHIYSSHWLIQCLQKVQTPFVLILDNADDFLQNEDAKRKQELLRFIEEILAQCNQIKLLLTTRESVDFLNHTIPVYLRKISALDGVSSASLVRLLLPDVSEDDCGRIVKECGQVPLAMRLMCSIMREKNISINEVLEKLKNSPLVEVLDSESFPDDVRLKIIVNTSFQRLSDLERKAFVSLAVFPGWFGIEEATAVLEVKQDVTTKEIIRSLERKSLIDCGDNFSRFTIHSLLRSFTDEERRNDKAVESVFHSAQLQFYRYYISIFRDANQKFLTGHSNEALTTFLDRRESILLALANGTREEFLYPEAVKVLSMSELFLYAVLPGEELLFEELYNTAVKEAKGKQNVVDERKLLAAKSFRHWGWFSSDRQTWDHSLYQCCTNEDDCPTKLVCYHGIHQLLCGKREEGISSLVLSVDRLKSSSIDENVLKVLVSLALEGCLKKKDDEKASHFQKLHENWFKARSPLASSLCETKDPSFESESLQNILKEDLYFFLLVTRLTSWVDEKRNEHVLYKIAPTMCGNQLLRHVQVKLEMIVLNCLFKEFKEARQLLKSWFPFVEDELSLDTLGFTQLELLRLRFVEFTDQLLQSGLESVESYNTTKQLMEALVHISEASQTQLAFSTASGCDLTLIKFINTFGYVLKTHERYPGRDVLGLARSYDHLGMIKRIINDYHGALQSYQQAIQLREDNTGDEAAWDSVSTLTNIGYAHLKMNNAIEARQAFQSALNLRKRLGVYDDLDTAEIYYILGEIHHTLGTYDKALEAHSEALTLRNKHLGEHTLTAKTSNEVGWDYYLMEEYQSAIESFQNALESNKELLGKHKDTAECYHNLGQAYLAMERYTEAFQFCKQALEMRLDLLGGHVDTAASYNLLGHIHLKKGENIQAVQNFKAMADMMSNLLGDHKDTAYSYHTLGVAYRDMGDNKRALDSLQNAADMRSNLLGDHRDTACSYHILGLVKLDMGDKTALECLQKAANIRSRVLGEHKDTARSYHSLGLLQLKVGDNKNALESLQKAADIESNLLDDQNGTAFSYKTG